MVLFYVLIVCTVTLPPGVNPIAVDKYIYLIAWYICKEAVFKVPITTLQRPKSMGVWEMTHIEAKCNALLLCRMYIQSRKEGTITAEWLRKWQLANEQENPLQSWKTL